MTNLPTQEQWERQVRVGANLAKQLSLALANNYRLRKALTRQADNMAFVVNHVDIKGWHDKFHNELTEDREALR